MRFPEDLENTPFCTFEIASLVNVPGHYLRKYGSLGISIPSKKTQLLKTQLFLGCSSSSSILESEFQPFCVLYHCES